MRDLGYSLETAIADLIDNSISAEATTVEVFCEPLAEVPVLIILDNGNGMNHDELIAAMRHGATHPRDERSPKDLGRFGLGLKTASFSQCRSLTVASKKDNIYSAAEWDLTLIDKADEWILKLLDSNEINDIPYVELLGNHGTAVIWRDLDRLLEGETGNRKAEIVNEKLDILERHLSLVFHKYLSGEVRGRDRLRISVNGHTVEPFDPFCRKNSYTRHLPEEVVHIGSSVVTLQPFILPHHSNLTAQEYDFYQSRGDFISNQGAYVYRNQRLMTWGDWFRLIPKGESTKLARVEINFPNTMDEAWTIDIKKSRSRPPFPVRERLRQIIPQVTIASRNIHHGRGKRLFQDLKFPLWERYADRIGIRYKLNDLHPLVHRLREKLEHNEVRHLDLLLHAISSSLPVEMIYSDYSTEPREVVQAASANDARELLSDLRHALWNDSRGDADTFRDIVRSTRILENNQSIIEAYISEEFI